MLTAVMLVVLPMLTSLKYLECCRNIIHCLNFDDFKFYVMVVIN